LVVRVQHQAGDLGMMTAGANVRSVYMVLPTNPTHGANDILPSMHWCMYSSIVAVTGELISRDRAQQGVIGRSRRVRRGRCFVAAASPRISDILDVYV
jgi:hypothetical protein